MAQKLRDDKIGTLQHNAGNIQMLASVSNPAYLTIGGQQYKITTNLTVALPSMSANTRYQVFAVNNAGTIELRITTNENSVGPTGFNKWKLIGSLIANGMSPVAFGSFLNIEGVPESQEYRADVVFNNTLIGFGVTTQTKLVLKRKGGKAFGIFHFKAGTVSAADARFALTNLTLDTQRIITDADVTARKHTFGWAVGGNPSSTGTFAPSELQFYLFWNGTYSNEISMTDGFQSSGGDGFPRQVGGDSLLTNNASMQGEFEVPIVGWSNTPIKDL